MGRLIDADKLRKQMSEDYAQSVSKISNPTVKAIVEKAVEAFDGYVVSAETVEAIPIEWIESYLSNCAVWSIAYYVIKQMLYKWREEQEGEQHETD